MKILIIGGNRFVGLRLSQALDATNELHVLNRSGQVAHTKNAVVYKAARNDMDRAFLDRDWDVVVDFAAYTGDDARAAIAFFKNVKRYIFISTASVYGAGSLRPEANFDAAAWSPTGAGDYQSGKRDAEHEFGRAPFPVAMIRFPFITGPDDYTGRLLFHIERVVRGQPIYVPNPAARISLLDSADGARFLEWAITQDFTGAVNVASPETISLAELLALIEKIAGKKPLLVNLKTEANASPYGPDQDFSLSMDRLRALGYANTALKDWLPALIAQIVKEAPWGQKPART